MEIEIDEELKIQLAKSILDNLPDEKKLELLEKSLAKTMEQILSTWIVEGVIKDQVKMYMTEHVKLPEVRAAIKTETKRQTDEMMDKVIKSIILNSESAIKSTYSKFGE